MTPDLIAHVKQFEGCSLKPYLCPADKPTIGYGHVIESLAHPPITQAQADQLLADDLAKFEAAILELSPVLRVVAGRRRDAITDFAYNCGVAAYRTSTLRKYVDGAQWPLAAAQMRKWVYAKGQVLPGLVRRRAVTAQWLERG